MPSAGQLAPWRPADALDTAGALLFVRASGRPLTDGIPGFYTPSGFRQVLLPALPVAAEQVAAESWVLGRQGVESAASLPSLEHDVVQLYEADFAAHWDALLADLAIAPARSLSRAAESLYVLGSPQSPMRDLLAAMAKQLTLATPPKPVEKVAASVGQPLDPAGHQIDARYKALRDYVGPGPGAPIDQALKAINGLQQDLARLASAPAGVVPSVPTDDPKLVLRAVAGQAPHRYNAGCLPWRPAGRHCGRAEPVSRSPPPSTAAEARSRAYWCPGDGGAGVV